MAESLLATWSAQHWALLGFLLLVGELVLPGTFLLWFGLAALVVAGISALIPLGFVTEFALFALIATVAVLGYRRIKARRHTEDSDKPLLNQRVRSLVGQVHTLEEPIVNGRGRLKIGDALWRIEGPDCEAGRRVRIADARELSLVVDLVDG